MAQPITTSIITLIDAEYGGPMKQAIPPSIPGSMAKRNGLNSLEWSCCCPRSFHIQPETRLNKEQTSLPAPDKYRIMLPMPLRNLIT